MLKSIVYNAFHATRLKAGWGSKFNYFIKLTQLGLKNKSHNNQEVSHDLLGFRMNAYSFDTLDFLFREIFITHDYLVNTTNPAPIIIDCGANIGMSAMYFKKLMPNCKIIAFEANPHTFKLLNKNIKDNNLEGITTHNVALFDSEGEISFYIGEDVGTLIGSVRADRGGTNEMKVPAQRLSSYLKEYEKVDVVKMDVEGAEKSIIRDLFETGTLSKVDQYIIEYHHNVNFDKSALSSFLHPFEECGFNYTIKTGFISKDGFQDILIHFYKA